MKIKICGLLRDKDIEFINEARPDYAGFVFAESRRQVTPEKAEQLRSRLDDGIVPVGVFVNAPVTEIVALYRSGVIEIAQLHGDEDEVYIEAIRGGCRRASDQGSGIRGGIQVIKVIKCDKPIEAKQLETKADYLLLDSGAGSGKTFDWNLLPTPHSLLPIPWFLAGGINLDNIEQAMSFNPYAIDVSSGAETDGVKDRRKILKLVSMVRQRRG